MTTLGIWLDSEPTEASPTRTPLYSPSLAVDALCTTLCCGGDGKPFYAELSLAQLTRRWAEMPRWAVLKELWAMKQSFSSDTQTKANTAYLLSGHTFQKHEQELKAA